MWQTNVCLYIVHMHIRVRAFVCLPYLPGGGPWSTLTRAIKVYMREAQLSIKLTGCPHPNLLLNEPHEIPREPLTLLWQRAGLVWTGKGWTGTGWGYGEKLAAVAWRLEKKILTERLMVCVPRLAGKTLRWDWWWSAAVNPSNVEGLTFSRRWAP